MNNAPALWQQARDIGLSTSWLASVEGRLTVAAILNYARCVDRGLEAQLLSSDDLRKILEKQGYRCTYCPDRIIFNFQLDHIKPIAKGGSHTVDNIQFTCPLCNNSKRTEEAPSRRIPSWPELYEDGMTLRYRIPQRW
jgi:hypothetical protein